MSITTSSDNKSANAGAFQQSALGARIAYPNYKYKLTITYEETRAAPFNLTIQGLNIDGTNSTTYIPKGNVSLLISGGDKNDKLLTTTTDGTGWTNGAKTVTGEVVFGGTTARSISTITAWEPIEKRSGSANVILTNPTAILCAVGDIITVTSLSTSLNGQYWFQKNAPTPYLRYSSVCWSPANKIFCAVSNSPSLTNIITSMDGDQWTTRSHTNANKFFRAVCWSPDVGVFVAAGKDNANATNGSIYRSTDGIAWTSAGSIAGGINNDWYSACWSPSLSLFCVVGDASIANWAEIATSPTANLDWTQRTGLGANQLWNSVCWSPDLKIFCAVAQSGTQRVMLSSDGITWTGYTGNTSYPWSSVCWSSALSLFCASGGSGRIMTSSDGQTWTLQTTPDSASGLGNLLITVTWSAALGLFIAMSQNENASGIYIMVSKNGSLWTTVTSPSNLAWVSVCAKI